MKDILYDRYFWQNGKVRLRAIQPEDWEGHYYNRFDSHGRRLLEYEVELPPTVHEAKEFAEKNTDFSLGGGRIMFTVENLNGENVGGINLNSVDEKNGTFSIGIQVDQDYRGKGIGTSAMRILLRYAFYERRLNKFNDTVLKGNVASATMLKKLGCKQEGVRRKSVYTNGEYHDVILFGMLKDEFIDNEE